ncbi:MAG: AmmeMemoRadiSam system radical SAM enzyme [Anaerolineales bacterium]|nr:AmmeMemoRadiSam system radical SAM enzyme [Anaerolineales bacterium]
MNHPAFMSRPLHHNYVQCTACEHWCAIAPEEAGKCGVRFNRHGELQLGVYGRAIATHIDPIEKKPLHHFLPGTSIFSLGTIGCNLACAWCQNWEISQRKQLPPDEREIGEPWAPEEIVAYCQRANIPSIAFTYNEPAVFFEYAFDTARLAHAAGIHTVFVTSGFETLAALDKIAPFLDAVNVDLKAFREDTYRRYCGARLAPVLRNIRHLVKETKIWTEVTTLVIPQLNDSDQELAAIAEFLAEIDVDIPWHVSGFAPQFQMRDRERTAGTTLQRAWEIGKAAGLHHVYTGNVIDELRLGGCSDTVCPQCGERLIERAGYRTRVKWAQPGQCPKCGEQIAGVWQ